MDEITTAWTAASHRMTELGSQEPGEPERISMSELPASVHGRLAEISKDRLFQASFAGLPTTFCMVELDRLVAPQREVNLDYVNDLTSRLPGGRLEDLIEFCIGPHREPPEWKILQTAQNQLIVTSKSLDLRFLGGYRKPLGDDDIAVAHGGGQPVEVVSMLIGYGAPSINVFRANGRMVLSNGFHRVVALRMAGVTHIPVVVQEIAKPEIEFPEQHMGLSRNYLWNDPRPVIVRDFFDESLTIQLRMTPRRKTVKISWGVEDSIIPV
jgi:hypothetical protein